MPRGVKICIPSHAIHRDEALYPSPLEYDAFRFSRPREGHEAPTQPQEPEGPASNKTQLVSENGQIKRSVFDQKNASLITTSDDFLSFGHGRHACPGRFFATQELKLMLAYLVLHYDVEPFSDRPQNAVMNGSSIPPANALLGIKMRKGVTKSH